MVILDIILGPLLCGLLEEYVKAVNDPNSIPCLENAWQNTVDLLRTKTMDELVNKYKTTLTVRLRINLLSSFILVCTILIQRKLSFIPSSLLTNVLFLRVIYLGFCS